MGNRLKNIFESHNITVKADDFAKAVVLIMMKVRSNVVKDDKRVILKIEMISFEIINDSESIERSRWFRLISGEKMKKEITAIVGVDVRYLENQQ